MRLSRTKAILLGLITVTPLLYLVYFLLVLMPTILQVEEPTSDAGGRQFFALMNRMFIGHAAIFLLTVVLIGGYVYYTITSGAVPAEKRSRWHAALWLGNIFVIPVFWYLYIWRRTKVVKS